MSVDGSSASFLISQAVVDMSFVSINGDTSSRLRQSFSLDFIVSATTTTTTLFVIFIIFKEIDWFCQGSFR